MERGKETRLGRVEGREGGDDDDEVVLVRRGGVREGGEDLCAEL